MNEYTDDDLLTERELIEQEFRGLIDVKTAQRWRREGRGPAFLKIGRHVAYRRGDVRDYLERCRTQTEIPPAMK